MGGPCYADEHIRLTVSIFVSSRSAKPVSFRLQGTAKQCLQRLHVEALALARWQPAQRLVPKTDFGSRAAVSAEDFYSASTFGGGRLELELCASIEGFLCSWLLPAVRRLQRLWRSKLRFRLRSDVQDLLQSFRLLVEARDARFVDVGVLTGCAQRPLVLAAAASGFLGPELARRVFRDFEQKATFFCIRCGAVYLQALCGLNCRFHYLPALQELTRSFMKKLGRAFCWFQEPAHVQHGCLLAQGAAEEHVKRSRRLSHFPPFETEVWSAVMMWALRDIQDAFAALQRHFVDERLKRRFGDLPGVADLLHKTLASWRSKGGPQLVCAKYATDTPVSLLHVLRPGENFGSLLRFAAQYFGIEHAQLLPSNDLEGCGHVLKPEDVMEQLGQDGLFMPVLVRPYTPDAPGLDFMISEVAKSVGRSFSLQRAEHLLFLRDAADPTCVCRVLLPEDGHGVYAKECQYYHMYFEDEMRMLTLRCNAQAFVEWVQEEFGGASPSRVEISEPEPTSLMAELQQLQGKVDCWLKSRWSSNLKSSRSCCGRLDGFALPGLARQRQEPFAMSAGASSSSDYVGGKEAVEVPEEAEAEAPNLREFCDFFAGRASWSQGQRGSGSSSGSSGSSSDPFQGSTDLGNVEDEDKEGRRSLSQRYFSPEVIRPATIGAAACATALMTIPPHTARVVSQVMGLSSNGAVMVAAGMGSAVSASVAGLSGGLAGAVLGGALGPTAALLGSAAGATVGAEGAAWLSMQPQAVNLHQLQHYRYYTSQADGRHYLSHQANVQSPGVEILVLIVLAQAGANGVRNLWSYANGELSKRDMLAAFGRDLRDGAIVTASAQGVLKALQLASSGGSGALASVSAAALQHPVPTLMAVLTTGLVASQCLRYSMGAVPLEQLRANSVLAATVSTAGIATNLLCIGLGLPFASCALLTVSASNLAGLWAYEAWRAGQQDVLEEKLLAMARDIFGVGPGCSQRCLDRRWRVLARMAHPDKNKRHDAKTTFALLRLCKEVLEMRVDGAQSRPASMYQSLVSLTRDLPRWLSRCRTRW